MSKRKLPDTSIEAYKLAHELATEHKGKILSALKKLGLAMGEEIAAETGLSVWQVMRRTGELEAQMKIYKTGIKRKTSAGRDAACYTLTNSKPNDKKRERKNKQVVHVQQTLL